MNIPEYTAYINKLMIDLYVKSIEAKEKEKIYEHVEYSEKELAKQFGAKWDKEKKQWYFTDRDSWEEFVNY